MRIIAFAGDSPRLAHPPCWPRIGAVDASDNECLGTGRDPREPELLLPRDTRGEVWGGAPVGAPPPLVSGCAVQRVECPADKVHELGIDRSARGGLRALFAVRRRERLADALVPARELLD
jgi:hypothetical protein